MTMLEAECSKCGETFVPADEEDTIHLFREDGTECGGQGRVTGEYFTEQEWKRVLSGSATPFDDQQPDRAD